MTVFPSRDSGARRHLPSHTVADYHAFGATAALSRPEIHRAAVQQRMILVRPRPGAHKGRGQ